LPDRLRARDSMGDARAMRSRPNWTNSRGSGQASWANRKATRSR
jgi:hypothetical protein